LGSTIGRPEGPIGAILSTGQNYIHSNKTAVFSAAFAAKLPSIEMRSPKRSAVCNGSSGLISVIDRPSYGELFYTVSSSELY